MRILCLNPPFKEEHGKFSRGQRCPAITKAGTFYYPIWLSFATGVLEQAGHDVTLIDAPAERLGEKELFDRIAHLNPAMVVIDTSTPSIHSDAAFGAKVKKRLPNALIVLVGTHPTALPEETLRLNLAVDVVTRREYDDTLLELANRMRDSGGTLSPLDLQHIDGISYRDGEEIQHTPDRVPIEDLDRLPFVSAVYKKHLDVKNYFFGGAQYPYVHLISGRGCPNRCIWCCWPQLLHGRKFRARSPENVVEEIAYVRRELPEVKDMGFEDDTFSVDQKRVVKICELIIKKNLKVSWYANVRATLKIDTMEAMKTAGCRFLIVGYESGNQQILNNIRKGITLEQSIRFTDNAKKAGLLVHGCMVVGNPGETRNTMRDTLKFAKELNTDTMQFFPIMVYPGTDAYRWAEKNGYLTTKDYAKWITSRGYHNCVVSTPELSNKELVDFCDSSRRVYYLRPRYLLYKAWQTLTSSTERGRNIRQLKNFWRPLLFSSRNQK